jgi:predicted  nucleic acid-binding Zn-ribbon protein
MSKKLLLSLASIGVLSAVGFVALQGNIGGLRSSVIRTAVELPAYSCAYYIPSLQTYSDLAGNSFASTYDENTGTYGSDPAVTDDGLMTDNRGLIPFCTPEMIAQYGSIGEDGIFVPYGSDDGTDTGSGNSTGTDNGTDSGENKPVSQLTLLLNAWNDAKALLASLETELKTLNDSQKTLTERKAVLEKKTGTESITAIQTRLASIEKELTAQLTALTKNTKLKSVDDYEPAVAQALADFDAINAEMIPLQNQLTTLTNIELKQLNIDLAKLKTDLTTLTKIRPQTTQTKADIANKNKEITAKNADITAKNKEITAKKAEIAKVQTRKTAAQTKYNTLKSYETKYVQPFRTKTNALNTEKATLSLKLETLIAELTDIKTKLGDRLPALPELIAKQKITVNEAQAAYTAYVATLATDGTGNGNGECNTTTGENCDNGSGSGNDEKSEEQKNCEALPGYRWNAEKELCERIPEVYTCDVPNIRCIDPSGNAVNSYTKPSTDNCEFQETLDKTKPYFEQWFCGPNPDNLISCDNRATKCTVPVPADDQAKCPATQDETTKGTCLVGSPESLLEGPTGVRWECVSGKSSVRC